MNRLLLWLVCVTAVGCGSPSSPTLDAAGEKAHEQQQREANSAEGRKPKASEKKTERNRIEN